MKMKNILVLVLALVAITPVTAQKPAKKITISGTVLDSDRRPIQGAYILIDNKKTESVTDLKGFYKVRVKPDAAVISIFTFTSGVREEAISGRTTINFSFPSKVPSQLNTVNGKEEAVDIGYGTIKRADMSTSVGKIDGQSTKYASYQNIYEMIRGEFPGVQVSGKSITIQGPSSINLSSEPLYVVDGMVVTTIDDIRPQHVKNIQILKGPSASIYGSRGATGVILINLIGAEKKK
jgi:TonB-dependent SusC/RagA subfamily outer membrane receptor